MPPTEAPYFGGCHLGKASHSVTDKVSHSVTET
ncbi:hypothetical protein ACVWWI_005687 [Bradyrhizobium sp. USDA 3686]|nr:hypothetical protein [Bradyrhizobium canariense]